MLVLGLILLLLSAGTLVAVLASGTDDHAVLYGGSLEMPTLVVFLAGAVALLVFILGLELVRSGIRRARENRRTKQRLRKLEKREELRSEDNGSDYSPTAGSAATGSAATGSDPNPPTGTTTGEHARTDPGPPSDGPDGPDGPAGPTRPTRPTTGP